MTGGALPLHSAEARETWQEAPLRPVAAAQVEAARERDAQIVPFDTIRPAQIIEAQAGVAAALDSIPDSEHERVQVAMNNRSDSNQL